jgi:hypothetical protein
VSLSVPLSVYKGVEFIGDRVSKPTFRRLAKYVAPMVFCKATK